MQVDKNPFPINTIDLQNSMVLVRPEQTEATWGKTVIIREKRTITTDEKVLSWEVVVEKVADGQESLKITIRAPTLKGGGDKPDLRLQRKWQSNPKLSNPSDWFILPIRPALSRGIQRHRSNRFLIPVRPALESLAAENFQDEESREREMGDRWGGLSV
jgi:hypothetical protein